MIQSFNPSAAEQTTVWFIGLIICAVLMGLLRKPNKYAKRNEERMRRHKRIQERQLGEVYRDDGYAIPQVLQAVALLCLTLLFIPCLYAIVVMVMGAQEPRW